MGSGGLIGFKYESTAVVQIHPFVLWSPQCQAQLDQALSPPMSSMNLKSLPQMKRSTQPSRQLLSISAGVSHRGKTLEKVTTMVSTDPRKGTDFIKIRARSHNQEDAHDIVNAVVNR